MKSPFAQAWEGKRQALLAKVAELNVGLVAAGQKALEASVVHGHHIVMKRGALADPARKILAAFDIPVLLTKKQITKAKSLDDLANIAMAINHNGPGLIHSEQYATAVNQGLQAIVDLGTSRGLSKDQIRAAIVEQLGEWRKVLERGESFW